MVRTKIFAKLALITTVMMLFLASTVAIFSAPMGVLAEEITFDGKIWIKNTATAGTYSIKKDAETAFTDGTMATIEAYLNSFTASTKKVAIYFDAQFVDGLSDTPVSLNETMTINSAVTSATFYFYGYANYLSDTAGSTAIVVAGEGSTKLVVDAVILGSNFLTGAGVADIIKMGTGSFSGSITLESNSYLLSSSNAINNAGNGNVIVNDVNFVSGSASVLGLYGAISNKGAGNVVINGGTLTYGTIQNTGTGNVSIKGGTVSTITHNGTGSVVVDGGKTGNITVASAAGVTTGNVTVNDGTTGNISMGNTANITATAGSLTINGGTTGTITMAHASNANITVGNLTINDAVKTGTITINSAIDAVINSGTTGAITNKLGTLVINDGTTGAITNSGTGTITINGGTINGASSRALTISGTGKVTINELEDKTTLLVSTATSSNYGPIAITNKSIPADTTILEINGGEIRSTGNNANARGIFNDSPANVVINGGTISATLGAAISNANTGKIIINQAAGKSTLITSASVAQTIGTILMGNVDGILEFNGGTIQNTATVARNLVYNPNGATLKLGAKTATGSITAAAADTIHDGVYDGSAKTPSIFTINGLTAGTDYTVTYTNNVNASNTTSNPENAMATAAISGSGSFSAAFSIAKAQGNAGTISATGWVFGSAPVAPTTAGAFSGYGAPTFLYSSDEEVWSEEVPVNAGDYFVKAVYAAIDNYDTAETDAAEFTIAKATATITAEPIDTVYDGDMHEVVATASNDLTVDVTYYTNEECTEGEFRTPPVNAGTYYAKIIIEENDNYVADPVVVSVTIAPAAATITADATQTVDFFGSALSVTAAVSNDLTPVITYYTNPERTEGATTDAPINAGTYYAVVSIDETNYVADPVNVTFTISKIDPSHTIPQDLTATFGQTLADVTLPTGWVWDAPATSVGNATTEGREFSATFTPVDTTNYNTITADLTVVVEKQLLVKPTATTTSFVFTGSQITLEVDGFDAETMAIENNAKTDVGSYTATITLKDAANYGWTTAGTATIEWSITEATITGVTVTGGTFTYDGAAAKSVAVSGTIAGDTVTYSTTESGTFESTNPEFTSVGTHTVYVKIARVGHTTLTLSATITINKAEGSASVAMTGWTFGGTATNPAPTSATNGTEAVTYEYKVKDANDSTYSATKPTNAGQYTVRATFAATENYNQVIATTDFAIAKAAGVAGTITITGWTAGSNANAPSVSGQTAEYGAPTYYYSKNGTSDWSEAAPTEAGTYYVKAVFVDSANYLGSETEPVEFKLEKKSGCGSVALDFNGLSGFAIIGLLTAAMLTLALVFKKRRAFNS